MAAVERPLPDRPLPPRARLRRRAGLRAGRDRDAPGPGAARAGRAVRRRRARQPDPSHPGRRAARLDRRSPRHGAGALAALVRLRAHSVRSGGHRQDAHRPGRRARRARRQAAPPHAAPPPDQLRQFRPGEDLRAQRPGHPRQRPDRRADRAPGRSAERSARHRHGRAAGSELPLRQGRLAPVRLRRGDRRGRVQGPQAHGLLAQRRGRQGRPRERVRPLFARPRGRRAGRGERLGLSWCGGSSRSTRCRATRW